jgi:hypothetical protein
VVDHPTFTKTKKWLENNKYIKVASSINGDVVIKPFYFNNVYLETNERFLCAAAMGNGKQYKELYNDGKPLYDLPNYIKEDNDENW